MTQATGYEIGPNKVAMFGHDNGRILFVRDGGEDDERNPILCSVEPSAMPDGGGLTLADEFMSRDVPWGEDWELRSETCRDNWFHARPHSDWEFLRGFQYIGSNHDGMTVVYQSYMTPVQRRYFGFDYRHPDREEADF